MPGEKITKAQFLEEVRLALADELSADVSPTGVVTWLQLTAFNEFLKQVPPAGNGSDAYNNLVKKYFYEAFFQLVSLINIVTKRNSTEPLDLMLVHGALLYLFISIFDYAAKFQQILMVHDPYITDLLKQSADIYGKLQKGIDAYYNKIKDKLPTAAANPAEIKTFVKQHLSKMKASLKLEDLLKSTLNDQYGYSHYWYISGFQMGLYKTSDNCITYICDRLELGVQSGAYAKQGKEQEAKRLIQDLKKPQEDMSNADKIEAYLAFKLGDQWAKYSDIMKDAVTHRIMFNPYTTFEGVTHDLTSIESLIAHNPADPNSLATLDPMTKTELDAMVNNIAVKGLLAYLVMAEDGVKISDYPGFYDPNTGEIILNPIIEYKMGAGVRRAGEVGKVRNLLLEQLLEAFPPEKFMRQGAGSTRLGR